MGYQLSRKAEDDILEIFIQGAHRFGLRQAEAYHDALAECFTFLAENPYAARERQEITPPVRVHPFGAHLVIYTVDESGTPFIIRVRHAHEDWMDEKQTPPPAQAPGTTRG